MPNLKRRASRIARQEGIDPAIFRALVGAESAWRRNARSPAGAVGLTQLMPATARGLGVNPDNPTQNLRGGAKYLRQQLDRFGGDYKKALAAYNAGPGAVQKYGGVPPYAETQAYVKKILGAAGGAPKGGSQHPSTSNVTNPRAGDSFDAGQSQVDLSLLMQSLEKPQRPTSSAPPAPAFSARNALALAGRTPVSSSPDRGSKGSGLDATLAALRTVGQSLPTQSPQDSRSSRGSGGSGPRGKVTIAPNANRPGADLNPKVVGFVRQVAGRFGQPLTIGTGTNHSQMTVNGNVSDHWDGNGADVPLSGRALVRAGQDALITAGMSRARARKQTGGLFNVGGWQIIFNTHEGGDHTTHLHVGRRH